MANSFPLHLKADYQGIRPALGYPACPDHTGKDTLWELLQPDTELGLSLGAPAAVSGVCFAHPESR